MDTPLQIAIITTLATILSVIVNQSISVWLAKKNEKKDKVNFLASILNDKKKNLENAKYRLGKIPEITVDTNLPIMIQAAKHVEHQFFYSKSVFKDVSHLLSLDKINEINKIHDMIFNKLADFKLKANKYESKKPNSNEEAEVIRIFDDAYTPMSKAIKLLEESIETELISTMKILSKSYETK